MTDWTAWHADYADPRSTLTQRLDVVRSEIRSWLDAAPAGDLRVLSACAGLGLDLIGALDAHARRQDVSGLLVEWDAELSARCAAALDTAGLPRLEAVHADAGLTSSLVSAAPADLLLLCGVFGNVADVDIRTTIGAASTLCAPGATVIWTRHRRAPDATPWIRDTWTAAGFAETGFSSPGPGSFSVGTCRLVATPAAWQPDLRLFSFV